MEHPLHLMGRCLYQSIRHPRTPILVTENPGKMSPIPWWGSCGIILFGLTFWLVGSYLKVEGLDEVGRALVYVPLGNLFGMSWAFSYADQHKRGKGG
jgi:hypothetical protein